MRIPVFIRLKDIPSADSIRVLLTEMADSGASITCRQMFAQLSVMPPAVRLAENLAVELAIISHVPVQKILTDGLLDSEREALLELEDVGISFGSLACAHGLLNLRERHFMVKSMRGFFYKHRLDTENYIKVSAIHRKGEDYVNTEKQQS